MSSGTDARQRTLFSEVSSRRIVVRCTACGKEIVVQEPSRDGKTVYSEYRDGDGRCFTCSRPNKKVPADQQ